MTSPHERLDHALKKRRLDLGMTWGDIAKAASISEVTLRAIRRGENAPSDLTKRRIENAVSWTHGDVDRILNGEDPTTEDPTPPDDQQLTVDERISRAEEKIAEGLAELRALRTESNRDAS